MDFRNEKDHFFNIKLAKIITLYQVLDPETVKYLGRNIYHIVMACTLLYTCLISVIMVLSGLYYWSNNIPISMNYFFTIVFGSYVIYKTWFVIHHSNDIWDYLSITRYDFTSIGNRHRHILDRWRERLAWLTNIYVFSFLTLTAGYLAMTLAFSGDKSPVKNHDGSIGYYRQNVLNLYLIVSDETYNAHYYMFYIVEASIFTYTAIYFIIFDSLLITLCYGMCCQMQIISSEFESVGHRSLRGHHSPTDQSVENINVSTNEHDLIHEELKTIIMDHQLVMKKYEDFLSLFRRTMLLHIFVSSLLVIVLCFTIMMSFSSDERFKTSKTTVRKLYFYIPPIFFQTFIVCYLFGSVHNQKDAITFALYSSNWTEMDMKCKKLILLTMKLNNANHKELKFTRTKIVNLDMFFKTMGDCYTVISVLANYI